MGGDRLERLGGRHQVLEPEPALGVGRGGRHDQDPDAAGLVVAARRHGAHPGDLRRRRAGELLVVLGGDGAVAGAQRERAAQPGLVDGLGGDAADGGTPVDDPVDAGDGRAQHPDRAGRHVALRPAADAVGAAPAAARPWAGRRRSGAGVPSGSRTAGPKCDLAGRPVDAEDLALGVAAGEGLDLLPALPAGAGGDLDLDRRRRRTTTGPRSSRNTWPGTPSDSPSTSSVTLSACTAWTVPPSVNAAAAVMVGLAL